MTKKLLPIKTNKLKFFLVAMLLTLVLTQAVGKSLAAQLPASFFKEYGAVMLVIEPESGAIRRANPAAARFYGYSVAQLEKMNIAQINALDPADVLHERTLATQQNRSYFIFPHRTASGEIRTVEVYSWPLTTDEGERLLFSVVLDTSGKRMVEDSVLEYKDRMEELAETRYQELISTQKTINRIMWLASLVQLLVIALLLWNIAYRRKAQRELRLRAFYDPLTGLPNRYLFEQKLGEIKNKYTEGEVVLAFAVIDLDHFKNINDALGHTKGDEVLKGLAKRLATLLERDEVLARFGGDEFTLLLLARSADQKQAEAELGQRLQQFQNLLSQPLLVGESEFLLGSSLGVSINGKLDKKFSELHKEADIALYAAKAAGRGTWRRFERSMQARAEYRFELEGELRKALDYQQLQLYLQPKINREGQVYGTESLVRWIHPEKGFIPPDEFIPLAEDTGMIVQLGDWVMQQTMLLMCDYPQLSFAVNISPRQFHSPDFFTRVEQLLEQTGADPRQLIMEVTENLLITDFIKSAACMHRLQKLGISFSIDDFGTGYSSLSYLKKLPINELKIDRSFIDGLPDDSNDVLLVQIMINIAGHLGLSVVAEGVETEQQRDYLHSVNCVLHQGYYYGKPEPALALLHKLFPPQD